MSKQFVKGNVYVFTCKKCIKSLNDKRSKAFIKFTRPWCFELNGNQIYIDDKTHGHIGSKNYIIKQEWCKCISNKSKPIAKPLSIDEIRELDEKLCEHCKCTFYGLEMGAQHISSHSSGCEEAYCEEAYEYYLDNFEEEI